jgi:hypothetical protein
MKELALCYFPNSTSASCPWKHFFYKIFFVTKRLFCSPKTKKDLNILENVENLLNISPSDPSSDIINKCHHFIKLHRVIENTNARKRLEKWAKRLIVGYLLLVLVMVILSSLKTYNILKISDTVIITILSTTTVNIIRLGLIVLRGHFNAKEDEINTPENKKDKDEV